MNIGQRQVSLDLTDRMHAAVRDDHGKKLYTVIGPNHNRGGIWTPCSAGVQAVTGDYRKAVADAETPVRMGDGEWSLDIGGYRLRPKAIVGFDKLDDAVFSKTPIESFKGAPLEADGTMRCFGADAWLRMVPTIGGVEVRHGYAQRINERAGTAYYGTIWEVDDPAVIAMLQADTDEDCRFHVKGNLLLEYFSRGNFYKGATEQSNVTWPQWWDESLPLEQTEHKYTTKSGNLGSDQTWTAGTYYISGAVSTNTWNLTLDASGGDIYIKVGSAVGAIGINGADTVATANTSLANRVIVTSMNDDTRGEAIAGSSGAPAAGDYTYFTNNAANSSILNLAYCEIHYAGTTTGVIRTTANGSHWTGASVTLDHVWFYNCQANGSSYSHGLIGQYRYTYDIGTWALSNIYIDSTCIGNNATFACVMNIVGNAITVSDCFVAPVSGAAGFGNGVRVRTYGAAASCTINNLYVQCAAGGTSGSAVSLILSTNYTFTISLSQCVAYNTVTTLYAIRAYTSNGTMNLTQRDNIALNASGVGGCGYYDDETGGTLNDTRYNCGDWNCTSRNGTTGTPVVTDNNPITANPSLGNLPVGAVIDTECVFPDGYAIGNLADYEMAGSQDFDTAAIDEATRSMTGWKYVGTKNVTPGIYYVLSAFPETFGTCAPNSGTTAGGTTVTVGGGIGWGATQGTGYVQIDGTDVVEGAWSDAGCTFTTPAHAAGAVNAVCVNYRGVTITGVGVYTYVSPTPPTPTTDSLEDLGTCALLWREPPNWAELPEQHTEPQREVLTMGSGTAEIYGYGDYQPRVIQYHYTAMDREDLDTLMTWHAARQGRLQRFWLPLWRNEFVAVQAIGALTTEVTIRWCGAAAAFQGYERIFILLTDGYWLTRHVSAAVDNLDGTETLTIVTPWDRDIAVANIAYLGRLLLVRHDEDTLDLMHRTAAVAEATLRYRELVNEYDDIEPGS